MEALRTLSAKLGVPKLEGMEAVSGKDAPALYFGATKINNNFDIVDAVGKEDGRGMTATFFVKDERAKTRRTAGERLVQFWSGQRLNRSKRGKAITARCPFWARPILQAMNR
jgi:hypothetical protein